MRGASARRWWGGLVLALACSPTATAPGDASPDVAVPVAPAAPAKVEAPVVPAKVKASVVPAKVEKVEAPAAPAKVETAVEPAEVTPGATAGEASSRAARACTDGERVADGCECEGVGRRCMDLCCVGSACSHHASEHGGWAKCVGRRRAP